MVGVQKLSPNTFYDFTMPTNPVTKPETNGEAIKDLVDGQERTEDDNRSRPWQRALENDKEQRGTGKEDTAYMWVAAAGTVAA
jgi:hypothetical protein